MSTTPSPAQTNPVSPAVTSVTNPVPSSRLEISNEQPVIIPSSHRCEHYPLSSTRPLPGPIESISQPPGSSTEISMARRYTVTGDHRPRRSSPSSDSQGGMADNEMESAPAGNSQQSGDLHSTSPPKKKRTRTLTTPHQSEVLHALLAQSRFPSTAVREEVGRAIGLSARKVQIWFQNQRQKAKRPRSRSAQPSSGAGQYGPPLTTSRAPDRPALTTSPIASTSHAGASGLPIIAPFRSPGMPQSSGSSGANLPLRLSGPGMTGFESRMPLHVPPDRGDRQPHANLDPRSPRFEPYPDHGSRHPASPPLRALRSSRPLSTYPSTPSDFYATRSARRRVHDPSRTLPPLVFNPPRTSNMPIPGTSRAAREPYIHFSSLYGGYDSHPPLSSPASPYSRQPLEAAARGTHAPSTSRPDSYAAPPPSLFSRPPPQWESNSWESGRIHHYADSPPGPPSPDEQILFRPLAERPLMRQEPSESPDEFRVGRYDPVRGVVLPYSSPPRDVASRAASPSPHAGYLSLGPDQ
jgi:hypothetical protein